MVVVVLRAVSSKVELLPCRLISRSETFLPQILPKPRNLRLARVFIARHYNVVSRLSVNLVA